jgi:ferritin-like metal-binding protein YciE
MSGTMTDTARKIYVSGLRNAHAMEAQAIELLQRQIGRLENYPEMASRMQQHLAESKGQQERLEQALSSLSETYSTIKDTALAALGNLMALSHAPAPDEVIKNTFANFAFEHYEMAAYQALITMAEHTGHAIALPGLQRSLQEEEAMARWIDEHIAPTTLRFLQRSEAGLTAGR